MNTSHDLSQQPSRVESLLGMIADEFTDRLNRGEEPQISDYLERFPELATVLRQVLPALVVIHESSATGSAAGLLRPALADPLWDENRQLGDFRVLREIGRGGMGIVYEAEQISLARRVALKVLPFAGALDPRHLARFRNEAQAAAQLHHTNIVPVYFVGCERNVHFFAMQFIEGETLAEVIWRLREKMTNDEIRMSREIQNSKSEIRNSESDSRSPSPDASLVRAGPHRRTDVAPLAETRNLAPISTVWDMPRGEFFRTAARLAIQAAEGLDYAHQRGIVHRDVKPGNLLVDTTGNVWITDFGVAQVTDDSDLTLTGDVVGTLRYMSPEQAAANRPLVDHRTDIYALGATLYELLTLVPIFDGRDRHKLLRQIANDEPRPLRRVNAAIPRELEIITLKALDKEPGRRYTTAQEMADDLRLFLEHRPIRSRPPGLAERVVKWNRRHRGMVAGASVAVLLCGVAVAIAGGLIAQSWQELERERGRVAEQVRLVDAGNAKIRRAEYVSNINRAAQAWRNQDDLEARRLLASCQPRPDEEDLRGFEWHLLSKLAEPKAALMRHEGGAYHCGFSHDGKLLVTSGQDGARIWDWASKKLRTRLEAHAGDVNCAAFSPDGTLLATAGDDQTVRIWETQGWAEQTAPLAHAGHVAALAFSPDGRILATAERPAGPDGFGPRRGENVVRLWDAATWTLTKTLFGHSASLQAIAFSPDGALLVTCSDDRRAILWDVVTGSDRIGLPHPQGVRSAIFLGTRPLLATACSDGQIRLWNFESDSPVQTLNGHSNSVESLCLSPNGLDSFFSAGQDGTLRLWEFSDFAHEMVPAAAFRGNLPLWCVAAAPDGSGAVTAAKDGSIRHWDRDVSDRRRIIIHEASRTNPTVEFSPDGGSILVSSGSVRIFEATTGMPICDILPATNESLFAVYGRAREEILVVNSSGTIIAYDPHRRAERRKLWCGPETIPSLSFPQSKAVTGIVRRGLPPAFVDLSTAAVLASPFDEIRCSRLAFSPDGRFLVTGEARDDRLLEVREWSSGELLFAPTGRYGASAWSRDSACLVAADFDGNVSLWQSDNWLEAVVFVGHTQVVDSLAFSADGRTLAGACSDNTVKLWNIATGRLLVSLETGAMRPTHVQFSPDGRTLAAIGTQTANPGVVEVALWYSE